MPEPLAARAAAIALECWYAVSRAQLRPFASTSLFRIASRLCASTAKDIWRGLPSGAQCTATCCRSARRVLHSSFRPAGSASPPSPVPPSAISLRGLVSRRSSTEHSARVIRPAAATSSSLLRRVISNMRAHSTCASWSSTGAWCAPETSPIHTLPRWSTNTFSGCRSPVESAMRTSCSWFSPGTTTAPRNSSKYVSTAGSPARLSQRRGPMRGVGSRPSDTRPVPVAMSDMRPEWERTRSRTRLVTQ
mmetsp:Transcript_54282/g.172334  ORF Transcript_54282/g.172334 Transcript_54282/m.172334 type:complete len:248 (-) Transcript_54282:736-1479(-)